MTDDAPKHLFSADRPIRSKEQDLLGRSAFTESLASAIKGWTGHDSLVIALYGPWGSGKSSVKNMVLESLHETPKDCPLIVEFNPWQWAGQKQLAQAFFQEVGLRLGEADTSKERKVRAAKWRFYASCLKAGSLLIGGIPKTIWLLLAINALFGIGGFLIKADWIRLTLAIIALITFLLASFLKWGGKFAESLGVAFSTAAEARKKVCPKSRATLQTYSKN